MCSEMRQNRAMDVTLPVADVEAALRHPLVEALLAHGSDGALVIDAGDRRILAMNDRARALLDYTPSEPAGCQCKRMMNSPACATACPLTVLLNGDRPGAELDLYYRGRDGDRVLHAHTRMLLLRGPDGTPLAGIELFRDLSEVRRLQKQLRERRSLHGIIGRSPAMQPLYDLVEQIAPYDLPVLITGESGVGKERFADALQHLSSRAAGPFVRINCAALTPTLVESELFGHRKGAFTGAVADRRGRFEEAHRGTLFLDEVGELAADVQAKLLRVLQEGEIQRLGEERTRSVDVRVLAATNRDLREEVAAGRFREDLYYRLVGVELAIPPLRERLDDLPLLVEHLLARFDADEVQRGRAERAVTLSEDGLAELAGRPWRGNVRELENVLRLAWIRTAGGATIGPLELGGAPPARADGGAAVAPTGTLAEIEAAAIERALAAHGGNVSAAARSLGVDRTTLHRKLKRGGAPPPPDSAETPG